jgi:hypothetical protein
MFVDVDVDAIAVRPFEQFLARLTGPRSMPSGHEAGRGEDGDPRPRQHIVVPRVSGSMTARTAIAELAVTAILLAGCAGVSPSPSPSPFPFETAVPTSSSGLAGGPTPSASPAPTLGPDPTIAGLPTSAPGCVLPVTVAEFGGWPGSPLIEHILSCFGNRALVVTGYLAPAWGIGGLSNGVTPSWLGEWDGLEVVLWEQPRPSGGCSADGDCLWMFLFAPKPAALKLTPERWVTLTGHFDDPLASTCRATGQGPDAVTSDAAAIATCRGHFVVTDIESVAPPAT